MILFFSGTGNSEYVADRIGKETGIRFLISLKKYGLRIIVHYNRISPGLS